MIGYNRRFYDFIPEVRRMIRTEPLLSAVMICPDRFQENLERYGGELREHILMVKTSHWLDLLLFLLGPLEPVRMVRHGRATPAYDGFFLAAGDLPVYLQAHFDAPSQVSLTLNFENFIAELRPMEVFRRLEGMEMPNPAEPAAARRFKPLLKEEKITDSIYKPGFYRQMQHFIETCVKKEAGVLKWGCSLKEALEVTRLCEEIRGPVGACAS